MPLLSEAPLQTTWGCFKGLVCIVPVPPPTPPRAGGGCDGTGPISRDVEKQIPGNGLRLRLGNRTTRGDADPTLPVTHSLGPNRSATSVSPLISQARRYQISRSNLQSIGKGLDLKFPGSVVRDRAPGRCPSDNGSAPKRHGAKRARKTNRTLSIHRSQKKKQNPERKKKEVMGATIQSSRHATGKLSTETGQG